MADIKDLLKKEIGNINMDEAKDKAMDLVGGLFSKKVKYTENEDGSISREVKVGKQKLNITAVKGEDGSYIVTDVPTLDDKNKQRITEKISKGKKLSKDEQLWTNIHDRTAVAQALQGMGYDEATAMAHLPYTKEQLTGAQDVGAFFVNMQGFEGDKTAFLAGVKQQMVAAYGAEAGEKHFNDFVAMSGLTDELQKLADQEKAAAVEVKREEPVAEVVKEEPAAEVVKEEPAAEVVKEEPAADRPVVENTRRGNLKEIMLADAALENQQERVSSERNESVNVSVKDDMKNDSKVAATRDLLNRRGVKVADKEATLNKLVENFGAEAAYEIALKCVIEPANTMKAMGEEFKRSGGAMEYFAAIDPNDTEKMAKIAELAGVPLKPMAKEPVRDMRLRADIQEISPAAILDAQTQVQIPDEIEPTNFVAEQKYAEMCKKLDKEALVVDDLVKMGATRQDFDFVLNKMFGKENGTSENIQSKVEKGFGFDGKSPVTKDFAVEVIGRVEDRKILMARIRGNTH